MAETVIIGTSMAEVTKIRLARLESASLTTSSRTSRVNRSVLVRLLSASTIDQDEFRAANEIAWVFEAVTRAVAPRVARLEGRMGGFWDNEWSAVLEAAYSLRYRPWRDAAGAVSVGHRHSLADLVLLVAVDGVALRQVADDWRIGKERVVRLFRHGLALYNGQKKTATGGCANRTAKRKFSS